MDAVNQAPGNDKVPVTSAGPPSEQRLQVADQKFKEAKALGYNDPDKAVELFGEVLQIRVEHYGPDALDCASTYLEYGIALYEYAVANTDVLGATAQKAVKKHEDASKPGTSAAAEQEAEQGEDGNGGEGDTDDDDEEEKGVGEM